MTSFLIVLTRNFPLVSISFEVAASTNSYYSAWLGTAHFDYILPAVFLMWWNRQCLSQTLRIPKGIQIEESKVGSLDFRAAIFFCIIPFSTLGLGH